MGYASLSGRARTSSRSPQAHAICDRCGFRYNHSNLRWQFDWAGASLINKRILVCNPCYDTPQNQLRAIILPADPVPVVNPRTEAFEYDETNVRVVSQPATIDPITGLPIPGLAPNLVTQDGQNNTTQPYGPPVGLDANAVMPVQEGELYGVLLPVLSINSIGTTTIAVTCSAPHNLTTNDQIAVEGITVSRASGFYSVTVISATAFTYEIGQPLAAQSLLTATTRIITAIVGLPYGYTQIPQVGT
mgnify:CR=1 FL=1